MAKWIGRQQAVGFAKEATRGTLVAPSIWIPKVNFTVDDKAQKALFEGNYNRMEGGDEALTALKWAEGNLELELTDNVAGLLMYGLFGTLSSGSFNSVYKHTLSVQQTVQPTTLSIFANDQYGSVSRAHAMAVINSFELTAALGDLVKANIGFVARHHKDYTAQTPSWTAGNKWGHHHTYVKVAADESSLDAASRISVQELKLSIDRSVIRENSLGTVQPIDILARTFKVTGSLKLTYEDRTYRDYMMNGTTKALRITLDRRDVAIGTTTPQLQIDLAKVHFFDWQPSQALGEVATQDVQFEALYDVTNSRLIGTNTFVVNSTASY